MKDANLFSIISSSLKKKLHIYTKRRKRERKKLQDNDKERTGKGDDGIRIPI